MISLNKKLARNEIFGIQKSSSLKTANKSWERSIKQSAAHSLLPTNFNKSPFDSNSKQHTNNLPTKASLQTPTFPKKTPNIYLFYFQTENWKIFFPTKISIIIFSHFWVGIVVFSHFLICLTRSVFQFEMFCL